MIPLEITPCGMFTYYKARRMVAGTQALRMVFGNASRSTIRKQEVGANVMPRMTLCTTKRVAMSMKPGRENYSLSLLWVNVI